MLAQFLQHLLSFDIAWLISLALGNLFLVFALFATSYIVLDGKKAVYGFLALCLALFASADFEAASGLTVFGAEFLAFNYITKVAFLAFIVNVPSLSRRLPMFEEMHFLASLVIFNFLIR